jgi:uncharacterized protein YggE
VRIWPVLALAMAALSAEASARQTAPASEPPVLVTVGEGIIKRAPDRAWVTIAAESRAKTPGEAQKLNADVMSGVMLRLRGAGLSSDAIRTSAYELRPEFDYANNRQTLRGYVARNTVEARIDDLPRLGAVLDVAVGAGATTVSGIRFDLKDRTEAEAAALQRAIADARTQAETAARAAGVKVERILRIEVSRDAVMPPPRPLMAGRAEMMQIAEPPIATGELEVRATVTLMSVIR